MDAQRLRQIFEALDQALTDPTRLDIRGGAAVLALGLTGRTTMDIDVLPGSRYAEPGLREACRRAGLLLNPLDKDFQEQEYLELVPEETLVLPEASDHAPYNTVFRGRLLTVRTPAAADLVVSKLKRLDPDDLADIAFLIQRFGLKAEQLRESFSRLPARFRSDLVLADNLRYVLEDFLDA
jgi:hypothetical protein